MKIREARTRRASRRVAGLASLFVCVALGLVAGRAAKAAVLFEESFDGLEKLLLPAVDETWDRPNAPAFTHVPPQGWRIDNSNMGSVPGVIEWQGWSFATLDFWSGAAGDQQRSRFTRGDGVFAIADPDEWDDKNNASRSGRFNSVLVSPSIAVKANKATWLHFDTHYRQSGAQTAEVRISFNKGADETVLRYTSRPDSDNAGRDVLDEHVVIPIPAPAADSTLTIKWQLREAGNDWFWAVDNIRLVDVPPPGESDFITLGPYVRYVNQQTAELRWQTAEPTASTVDFGIDDPPAGRIEDSKPRTKHVVVLQGLKGETVYRYCIRLSGGSLELESAIFELDTSFNCAPPVRPEAPSPFPADDRSAVYDRAAKRIIETSRIERGYCLILGFGEGRLAYELAKRTDLKIVGVEDDGERIDRARRRLRDAGLYGSRITVHECSGTTLPYASCFANLVVSERAITTGQLPASAKEVYRVLRPCGGVVLLGQPPGAPESLSASSLESWFDSAFPEATISADAGGTWGLYRRGNLPGAGEWSHQYADTANTACSGDRRTSGPMRLQWFGRPGAGPMIDRGGRTAAPLSVNGRVYVLGYDRLFGIDAYNGTVLWSLEIPGLRRANVPRDSSNLAADDSHLYVAFKGRCWVIDGQTGKVVRAFNASSPKGVARDWGYLAAVNGQIFGSAVKPGSSYTGIDSGEWYDGWGWEGQKVTSEEIFSVNRDTGKRTWTYKNGAVINPTVSIADGRVFFVECRSPRVMEQKTGRIGIPELWADQYLVALDAKTGEKIWERYVTFPEFDAAMYMCCANRTLVVAGSRSGDKRYHVYGFDAADGRPMWDQDYEWLSDNHGKHIQHPAIVGDNIYLEPCVLNLRTGQVVRDDLPMRNKCGAFSASAGALFFRDYYNGMWDLANNVRSEWFGIRAGCWLNLIPAGGLLLAPETSSGCSCPFPIQTSHAYLPR